MSTDTSTPVNISDLYQMVIERRPWAVHAALSQLSAERLEELALKISSALDDIKGPQAAPLREVFCITSDLRRVRKSDEAFARLMGGVA